MEFYSNSIFWIETEKIKPNPFQPRIEFDEVRLKDLAMSIRQYGILQPLVVTRKEFEKPEGGIGVEYELISGERRLRASKLAGLSQVPAIIKTGDQSDKIKLELAIIENLQREDLNPVDRAKAFKKLADEFSLKHHEIAEKVGKSREYVSNSIRLLLLPAEMLQALAEGRITEGHTRPILMLGDRPEEQLVLFKEIMLKRMTVREAEGIARRIAFEKVRKLDRSLDPEFIEIEGKFTEALGTRVQIERKQKGGKIHIEFFDYGDLRGILDLVKKNFETLHKNSELITPAPDMHPMVEESILPVANVSETPVEELPADEARIMLEDKPAEEIKKEEEEESYDLKNFSI